MSQKTSTTSVSMVGTKGEQCGNDVEALEATLVIELRYSSGLNFAERVFEAI